MLEALPFDQFQRYGALRLAADALRARLGRPLRILDVGDWNGLAAQFCPDDLTVWLDPTGAGSGRYVQAHGARLPFADRSFDLVACLDTLEHVVREDRAAVVAELHRAAESVVVVAVPVADDGSAASERALYDYVWDVLGGEQQQLREHAERGLPTRAETRAWFESAGWRFAEVPSGLLPDWLSMMVTKHALLGLGGDADAAHRALDERYNRRHGSIDPAKPAYRHVLISARDTLADLAEQVVGSVPEIRQRGDAEDALAAETLLVAAHARRAGATIELCDYAAPDPIKLALASRALERAVRDGRAQAEAARRTAADEQARADGLARRVRAYESGRFIRVMAAVARLRARLGR